MTEVADRAGRLGRLAVLLEMRGLRAAPVLAAVASLGDGAGPILVGATALDAAVEVIMPYQAAALAQLVPGLAVPALPALAALHVRLVGSELAVGVQDRPPADVAAAIAGLEAASGPASWEALVSQLCAFAGGQLTRRTRWLGPPGRASLQVDYPARGARDDQIFMLGIEQLAEDVGVTAAQRRLWKRLHPDVGHGAALSVITALDGGAVVARLGLRYPVASWDLALRLADGLAVDPAVGRQVGAGLGSLAGALGSERPLAVELGLGASEPPQVVVWSELATRS